MATAAKVPARRTASALCFHSAPPAGRAINATPRRASMQTLTAAKALVHSLSTTHSAAEMISAIRASACGSVAQTQRTTLASSTGARVLPSEAAAAASTTAFLLA
ncbi:hypothetical protein CF326_g945 [Tilletia indica]|nr:hypothetical protein CF326_g945 [Tilletia indica]